MDLNLVRAFVAIYETRSVTKAAERLSVTQPALSHALSKLREHFGDRLFVRGAQGLTATSLADQLHTRLGMPLAEIERALAAGDSFDPVVSSRRFRIAMSDMGVLSFTRPLLQRFQARAPNVEIEISKVDGQVSQSLATGGLDAVVGNLPDLALVTHSTVLFREQYVCLMAADHPTIGERLSAEEFVQGRHIVLSTPTPGNQRIDEALKQQGMTRRVVARVPHFSGLTELLVQSDLLVVVPSRAAQLHVAQGKLKIIALPVEISGFEVRVYWHARNDTSEAHRWLINEVTAALQQ